MIGIAYARPMDADEWISLASSKVLIVLEMAGRERLGHALSFIDRMRSQKQILNRKPLNLNPKLDPRFE